MLRQRHAAVAFPRRRPTHFGLLHRRRHFSTAKQDSLQAPHEAPQAPQDSLINVGGRIWFDNLSTPNLFLRYRPDLLQYFKLLNPAHPETRQQLIDNALRDFIPRGFTLHGFRVDNVVPRIKDRGLLMEFQYRVPALKPGQPDPVAARTAVEEIMQAIQVQLGMEMKENGPELFSRTNRIRAFLVKGEPFIEDMYNKTASSRLRVDFFGPDPPIETLYREFRPFGRIMDVTYAPPTVKDPPRFAFIQFRTIPNAASAKNCLHSYHIDGTRLSISYERLLQTGAIRKWIVDHPRVSVPLAAAFLIAIPAAMFDPIRVWSIKTKVRQGLELPGVNFVWWIRIRDWFLRQWYQLRERVSYGRTETSTPVIGYVDQWGGQSEPRARIQNWLAEKPSTFMLLVGPSGLGKSQLVESIIKKKGRKLMIRCNEIVNKSEQDVVAKLTEQVGYFPVFSSLNSFSKMADTVLAASTGQKTGLSSSFETQIKHILELTAVALSEIVEGQQKRNAEHGVDKPIEYPVIVIDGFMSMERAVSYPTQQKLYDELAAWAAFLAQNQIAHVIFISTGLSSWGQGANKILAKALPSRAFETITFRDPSPEHALQFLKDRLADVEMENKEEMLQQAAAVLGGRLSDLGMLVAKIHAGMTVEAAMQEILVRAIVEIRKYGLGEEFMSYSEDGKKREWSTAQFWFVLKQLAGTDRVLFDSVKQSTLFKGKEEALYGMEKAELVTILYDKGHPEWIQHGKPMYRTAFQMIVTSNASSTADFDHQMYKELIKLETGKVKEYEQELKDLAYILNGDFPESTTIDAAMDTSQLQNSTNTSSNGSWFNWWSGASRQVTRKESLAGLMARHVYLTQLLAESQKKIAQWHVDADQASKRIKEIAKKQ